MLIHMSLTVFYWSKVTDKEKLEEIISDNIKTNQEKQYIDLFELKAKGKEVSAPTSSATKTSGKKSSLNLGSLAINNSTNNSSVTVIGNFGDRTEGELDNSSRTKWGKSEGTLYEHIYSRIYHSKIHYAYNREVYDQKKIEGNVKLRIVFNKDGTFNEKLTKVKSSSNYLTVIVYRILREQFSKKTNDPLFKNIRSNYFTVDATFDFVRRVSDYKNVENAFINGNLLSFVIVGQGDPVQKIKLVRWDGDPDSMAILFTPESFVDYFTDAGKARRLWRKEVLENYKNDPAWDY